MSQYVLGYGPSEHKALWMQFVEKQFQRTRYTVTFNGDERRVYTDRTRLYVLDKWHGHLEVLELKERAGRTSHLGVQDIEVVWEQSADGRSVTVKEVRLGAFHPGGTHDYILIGSYS